MPNHVHIGYNSAYLYYTHHKRQTQAIPRVFNTAQHAQHEMQDLMRAIDLLHTRLKRLEAANSDEPPNDSRKHEDSESDEHEDRHGSSDSDDHEDRHGSSDSDEQEEAYEEQHVQVTSKLAKMLHEVIYEIRDTLDERYLLSDTTTQYTHKVSSTISLLDKRHNFNPYNRWDDPILKLFTLKISSKGFQMTHPNPLYDSSIMKQIIDHYRQPQYATRRQLLKFIEGLIETAINTRKKIETDRA